jgi:hypothetical protein
MGVLLLSVVHVHEVQRAEGTDPDPGLPEQGDDDVVLGGVLIRRKVFQNLLGLVSL